MSRNRFFLLHTVASTPACAESSKVVEERRTSTPDGLCSHVAGLPPPRSERLTDRRQRYRGRGSRSHIDLERRRPWRTSWANSSAGPVRASIRPPVRLFIHRRWQCSFHIDEQGRPLSTHSLFRLLSLSLACFPTNVLAFAFFRINQGAPPMAAWPGATPWATS